MQQTRMNGINVRLWDAVLEEQTLFLYNEGEKTELH